MNRIRARRTAQERLPRLEHIRNNNERAIEKLYKLIQLEVTRRGAVSDLDDAVHDCLVIILEAVRRASVRDADQLASYIKRILRRELSGHECHSKSIRQLEEYREHIANAMRSTLLILDPEIALQSRERERILARALSALSYRERELLRRFYFQGQAGTEIRSQMGLGYAQFSNLKHRAKTHFIEKCQAMLNSASES